MINNIFKNCTIGKISKPEIRYETLFADVGLELEPNEIGLLAGLTNQHFKEIGKLYEAYEKARKEKE